MLRILPDSPVASNNDNHFLEEVKRQLEVELVRLGVDDDFLYQNFVIFDVKDYNEIGLNENEVIEQAKTLLKNASILLQSIQYLKLSNNIDSLIAELYLEN